jgi:hypothetical protein
VRLQPTPQGAAPQIEARDKTSAATEPVMMDRMVVGTSPLPARPMQPEPERFSLQHGGPVVQEKLGQFPIALGLWSSTDAFSEEAKFKPQKTRADFDVARVKW